MLDLAALGSLGFVGGYQQAFGVAGSHHPAQSSLEVQRVDRNASGGAIHVRPTTDRRSTKSMAVASVLVATTASMSVASARRRGRRQTSLCKGRTSAVVMGAEASTWQPRNTGWSNADLLAERQRAAQIEEPDRSYAGPRYTGAGSITDAFITSLISMQEKGAILPKKDMYMLVLDVIDILRKESSLQDVRIPQGKHLTVVGDLHGQYWDFMNLLKLAGRPSPETPFIFNGDFVDRGSWSIEVISVLFAMKLKDPGSVFLNRGNHEMLETNILYGFCGECGAKYDMRLFDLFSECFRNLPLGHLVEKKVLVLHAGLPGPDPRVWMPGQTHDPTDSIPMTVLPTLEDIKAVDRYLEITPESYASSIGPSTTDKEKNDMRKLIDILWSDPRGGTGYGPSYRKGKGVYMFGPDVTKAFCEKNGLQCIIRSHEVKADGFRWDHPELLSVFSAPNYLDTGNNKGSFLKLSCTSPGAKVQIEPVTYAHVPHPDIPPMHWQENITNNYSHLLRKMKKKDAAAFDEFGDSDFQGINLMNFDEWEPDEADQFQQAFKLDQYGREMS